MTKNAAMEACDKCIATMEGILADQAYLRARSTLLEYLKHKVDLGDWHGVSDAANDLRVLEAEHSAHIFYAKQLHVPETSETVSPADKVRWTDLIPAEDGKAID